MKGGDAGCKSSWGLCVRVCGLQRESTASEGLRRPATTTMMMLDGWPPSCVGRGTAAAGGVNVGVGAAQRSTNTYHTVTRSTQTRQARGGGLVASSNREHPQHLKFNARGAEKVGE